VQQLATRLRRTLSREDGLALEFVIVLLVILAMLSVLLTTAVLSSQQTSANAASQADARAAAEAGIDNYISTLLLDNQYFLQYLAPGEATRKSVATGDVLASALPPSSPTAWASSEGTQWSYPNGKDAWVDLGDGYSYDLEVTPPQTGSNGTNYLQIVSTGAKNGSSATTDKQAIQVLVRPASVADFQMLSAATVAYGTNAVTQGKIYSSQNVDFCGNAYADVYAEGQVYTSASQAGCGGNGTIHSPASAYDSNSSPTIRTPIKTPVNFASFQVSLDDISRAAALNTWASLPNNGKAAWEITFDNSGNVSYRSCTGSQPIETTQPSCTGPWTTKPIPTNGAIYSALPVLIAGGSSTCSDPQVGTLTNATCVGGRVTIASAGNIVIGDDIGYSSSGTDVLGLMAQNNVLIASWVGSSLTWRAAALAENGCWSEPQPGCDGQSTPSDGSHSGTMTFTGSSATYSGGAMSMFSNRSYNYDTTLAYLQPPWFPTLPQAYTILLYRNLPNGS
jgi:Tfp pilus assembly protein PilX